MKHDVAGDPCTGVRWTRRTTEKISEELRALGIHVSPRTVARILKDLDYTLRVNHKRVSRGSGPDRNEQFEYIAQQRTNFAARNLPIVSVDSKKKELIGNFKNAGTAWRRTPEAVNDHDFRSDAAPSQVVPFSVVADRPRRPAWSPFWLSQWSPFRLPSPGQGRGPRSHHQMWALVVPRG